MERLYALAQICKAGFDVWETYSRELDRMYTEDPGNDELYRLKYAKDPKDAIIHTIFLMENYPFDVERFCNSLMEEMSVVYKTQSRDIKQFYEKAAVLSRILPWDYRFEYPFYVLDCDYLEWGYFDVYEKESKLRTEYEKAFALFERKQICLK
ncbi:MAG: hypothetical protein J5854_02325 [Clostridia bacterium]|nr:hypothetical protein [Clostridia bacterium]